MSLILLTALAMGQDRVPPGEIINGALAIDLTDAGATRLAPQIGALLPDTVGGAAFSTTIDCPLDCNSRVSLDVTSADMRATLQDAEIWSEPGVLHFVFDYNVRLNRPLDPAVLVIGDGAVRSCDPLSPCCTTDQCLTDTCDFNVPAFPIRVDVPLQITVDDPDGIGGDPPVIGSSVGTITHNIDQVLPNVQSTLANCTDPDTPLRMAQSFPLANDIFRDPLVDWVERDLPALLGSLGSLFDALSLEEELDLGGVPVTAAVSITNVDVRDGTTRLGLDASIAAAEAAACVAAYDPGGSLRTDNPEPAALLRKPTDGQSYDLGVLLGDDFLNQATYALWRSGSFCFDLDASSFGVDTDLLAGAFGELTAMGVERVFGNEPQSLIIEVVPTTPPEVAFTDGPHARMWLRDLSIRFVTRVHERRVILLDTRVDLPADVAFVFTPYGEIGFSFAVAEDALAVSLLRNDFFPEAWYELDEGFDGFLGTMVGIALGSFLGDGYLPLVLDGLGPTSGAVVPRGEGDYLELLTVFAPVAVGETQGSIDVAGCLGCDPADCEDCSATGRRPTQKMFPWWLIAVILGLPLRRFRG